MRKKFVNIAFVISIVIVIIFLQCRKNGDKAANEASNDTGVLSQSERYDAMHEEKMATKPSHASHKNADQRREHVQTILDSAALEMSKIACAQKDELIAKALEHKDTASFSSLLLDISRNQCLPLKKRQMDTFLNVTVDEHNLIALIDAYKVQINNTHVMQYLELFRFSMDALEGENSENLRRGIFSALRTYIQNSVNVLDIAVSLKTISELAEKRLLSKDSASKVATLEQDFEREKLQFYRDAAAVSANYKNLTIDEQSPSATIASHLGVEGAKAFVDGVIGKEYQIAESWKGKLLGSLE